MSDFFELMNQLVPRKVGDPIVALPHSARKRIVLVLFPRFRKRARPE
jgi:hypothetical protein